MKVNLQWDWPHHNTHQQQKSMSRSTRRSLVVGDISTDSATVIQVGVDARVKLVGQVGVVRASSSLSVSRAWGVVAATTKGTATELLVTSSVVPVRVNSRV